MTKEILDEVLKKYVDNHEIAGAVVMIRKDGKLIYDKAYGYSNLETKELINKKTMLRLASMTKPLTAIAILRLYEEGKIKLEDFVSKYLPEFSNQKVYEKEECVTAERNITIFDLLTHSSGAGQGTASYELSMAACDPNDSIRERVAKYAKIPLDFQPGSTAGYSPVVGFEILSAIIEVVSGKEYAKFLYDEIFEPMGITDITFTPNESQISRMAKLYFYDEKEGLADVSETEPSWQMVNPLNVKMHSAAAGILGTVEEYDKITTMFLNDGNYGGKQILKPETVALCKGQDISHDRVMLPGTFWGMGMLVYEKPELTGSSRGAGSYGWSGSYGTHFWVDPVENFSVVLGVSRSNIGGAASYVSMAVEKAVYQFILESKKR